MVEKLIPEKIKNKYDFFNLFKRKNIDKLLLIVKSFQDVLIDDSSMVDKT